MDGHSILLRVAPEQPLDRVTWHGVKGPSFVRLCRVFSIFLDPPESSEPLFAMDSAVPGTGRGILQVQKRHSHMAREGRRARCKAGRAGPASRSQAESLHGWMDGLASYMNSTPRHATPRRAAPFHSACPYEDGIL